MVSSYKSLHEILKSADPFHGSCGADYTSELIGNARLSCKGSCSECMSDVLKSLGEKIENEYALLPVDDKGKPWHIGDECIIKDTRERARIVSIEYTGSCRFLHLDDDSESPYIVQEIIRPLKDSIEQVIEDLRGMYDDRVDDPDEWLEIADRLTYLKEKGEL